MAGRLPPGTAVGLVGFGYYTLAVADLCAEAGYPVAFAVDDREGVDGDPFGAAYWLAARGVAVLSPAEFAQRMWQEPCPLVLARVECPAEGSPGDEPFAQADAWVRRTCETSPLIHPVALLDLVPPARCPGRHAVVGYPGSGNVLLQKLVEGLAARRATVEAPAWQLRAGIAEHHFRSTLRHIRAALAPFAPETVDLIPHHFGTMLVTVEWGRDRVGVAFGVPSPRHHALRTFATHARPARELVDYFESTSAPCFAIVRHPFETLLSLASKVARPARSVLDDPHFLDHVAAQLADWLGHLRANRDRVFVVRYEDLMARRVDVLQALAGQLGNPISEPEADGLYDAYLNRTLADADPPHFHLGGSDKWRREFSPADFARARARLPDEAFTEFGYPIPSAADLRPGPASGTPTPRSEYRAGLAEVYPLEPVPGGFGIRVTSGDAGVVEVLRTAFQAPALLSLFAGSGCQLQAALSIGGRSVEKP